MDGIAALGTLGAVSSVYETDPVGDVPQGPYLNAVAVVETSMAPRPLLDELLALERAAGRERRIRWGPRTLDLDLLVCGGVVVDAVGLAVPHPELLERRFVLEPLLEAWPDAPLPGGADPVAALSAVAGQGIARFSAPDGLLPPG